MRNVAARACAHASLLPFPPPGLLPGPRPPLAVVFPEGMTRAFPRGCVRNLCLVYHNTEDRNGPYQGFAELVKSFLILPTKENWCGNKKKKKKTASLCVGVFICSALSLPRVDSSAWLDCSTQYLCKLFIQPLNSSHRGLLSCTCIRRQCRGCLLHRCSWSDPQLKG